MSKRRKPFTKKKNPGKLEPTAATTEVLKGIYAHEGVMSQRQIIKRFFPGCSSTWPEVRLTHYYDHRLLKKHDASFVNGEQLGEIVYTLDTAGVRYLRSQQCAACGYISSNGPRRTNRRPCAQCGQVNKGRKPVAADLPLKWRRNPRWSTLAHDLKINDFRLAVTLAAQASPRFELVQWISEYELSQKFKTHGRLDGFFRLRRQSPTHPGRVEELAILSEIDMANHPLNRFVKRKVKPALSFVGSGKYERAFGVPYGTCFVITTGQGRLSNLKAKTEEAGGNGGFYFTTFDEVSEKTVLTEPIWQLTGSRARYSLAGLPLEPGFQENTPQEQRQIPTIAD
jgi:hypothetical protein